LSELCEPQSQEGEVHQDINKNQLEDDDKEEPGVDVDEKESSVIVDDEAEPEAEAGSPTPETCVDEINEVRSVDCPDPWRILQV